MAKINAISVAAKDKKKEHKVEIIAEFNEPVTQGEAQELILQALSMSVFDLETREYPVCPK